MKRFVVAAVLIALGTPSWAAEPPIIAYNWSGVYIGAGLGGDWSQGSRFMPDLPLVGIPPTTFLSSSTNVVYSAHIGAQWQWGQWVFGVEGTYNATPNDMRMNVSVSPPEPFTTLSATTKVTDLVTIGPKIGYAWDRLMVYATGGYAGANVNGLYTCTGTDQFVFPGRAPCNFPLFGVLADLNLGGKTWNNGWFLGFGFDYVLFRGSFADVLIGAEYQHFELERKPGFTCTPAVCGGLIPHQSFQHDAKGDIVRARLSFKLNPFGR